MAESDLETLMPSGDVRLHRVSADQLIDVEAVFDALSEYSRRIDGRPRRTASAYEFATALPLGSDLRDKHAFVAYRHGLPVGLLDIIDGYPNPGTAFIGLLAVREGVQGTGFGRQLYAEAERFMRDHLKARTVRLAVVEVNPVMGFWQKMGFRPTGEVKFHHGEAARSRSILLEKALWSASH